MKKRILPCRIVLLVTSSVIAAVPYGPLRAQGASAESDPQSTSKVDGIADIIVTAEKRSGALQRVPLAVTAFGAAQLERVGAQDLSALAGSIPNFNFGHYNGNAQISIRGLGYDSVNPGAEGRVAVHLDGVYLSRPSAATAAFYDIERIEVLRGPQGSLYGRNATAGSVNFITRDPTQALSGFIRQTIGNYNNFISEGAIGGGLGENIAVRVAGRAEFRDGFGKNVVTGHDIDEVDSRSIRAKVLLTPTSNFKLLLAADYHHENDTNGTLLLLQPYSGPVTATLLGEAALAGTRNTSSIFDPANKRNYWGLASTATLDLGAFTLKSITGYRDSRYDTSGSFDGATGRTANYDQFEDSRTLSEELQLSYSSDKVNWLLGAYYFDEKINLATTIPFRSDLFGITPPVLLQAYQAGGKLHTKAAAIFGQLTYKFTDQLSLTLGERIGWEKKSKDDYVQFDLARPYSPTNPVIAPHDIDSTHDYYHSPRISLNYQATRSTLIYATYSQGYKSGGFDVGSLGDAYSPEKLTDYEAGIKSQWLNNRLRTNISGFYYDYKDLQLAVNRNFILAIENAASAKIYGIEAEIAVLPVDGLELNFTGGYMKSKYQGYQTVDDARPTLGTLDLSGNRLLQAPKLNTETTAGYSFDVAGLGKASLYGSWKHKGKIYFSAFNVDPDSQKKVNLFDASFSIEDFAGRWSARAFVRNITDKLVRSNSVTVSNFLGPPTLGSYLPPRQYGLTLGYNF